MASCILCGTDDHVLPRKLRLRQEKKTVERPTCKRCASQFNWKPGPPPKIPRACGAPYGFEYYRGRTRRVREEQVGIRRILQLRMQGHAFNVIAKMLNKEGVPTKRGGDWRPRTVKAAFYREAPKVPGGNDKPRNSRYGYRRDSSGLLVEDDYEQQVIAWMAEQRSKGVGPSEIAELLNQHSVRTKRGGKWAPVTVTDILGREGLHYER